MRNLSRREILRCLLAASVARIIPTFADQSVDMAPLIIDGHVDLGWNIINFERDYTRSVYDIRADEAGTFSRILSGDATLGLPEWQAARVALIFGVIFAIPRRNASADFNASYTTVEEARTQGIIQLNAIKAFADSSEAIEIVQTADDLTHILNSWDDNAVGTMGIVLAMEGADPIQSPDDLHWWHEQGVRSIGLSWGQTQYAGSASEPTGLTDAGRILLREMQSLNMLLDTAHLSEAAFWDAIDIWDGAIAYTHGTPRHFMPHQRALSDEQIEAINERDGVIGIGLYDGFYTQNLMQPPDVTVDDVANAIDYVCQLVGNCNHVAIGSDLDGGFGAANNPHGIDTVADLPQIITRLQARGYSKADINRITHENWLRLLNTTLT